MAEFIEYNKRNFSRIYPKGSRTMSSNYNPEPFWSGGSQLVALNLQTMGKIVWTNSGKFKDNGGCGYILKPYYMLHDYNSTFDEDTATPINPIRLNLEVISAHQLTNGSKSDVINISFFLCYYFEIFNISFSQSINPSVTVSIRGFKVDTKSLCTSKVKGNGFNPSWCKKMEFDIMFPENAVLLFLIYSELDTFKGILKNGVVESKTKIAYYALPISCIRPGYRTMELYAMDGSRIPMADLFCRFTITHLTGKQDSQ